MRHLIERTLPAALILALPFALAPATASAQEEEQEPVLPQETEVQEQCTVALTPQQVATGEVALRLQGDLTTNIGEVEGVEAGESGLVVASRDDIRGAEVEIAARPEEPPTEEPLPEEAEEEAPAEEEALEVRPIETSPDGARVTVWLNTENAEAGTHAITLKGTEGECTAELTVEGDDEPETEEFESMPPEEGLEQEEQQPPAEEQPEA